MFYIISMPVKKIAPILHYTVVGCICFHNCILGVVTIINPHLLIASISPDGRTLLSVGDSNKIYFHQITGGARITFQPITTLTIPPPDSSPLAYSSSSSPVYPPSSYTSLAAAFSTAFSGDGSKFAVASQEGVVAVWDVRSTKPMKVFHTNKTRGSGLEGSTAVGNGGASGWLSDDPWEWTRGTKAPGWCVRNVKFNSGEGARLGREVMAFTEVRRFSLPYTSSRLTTSISTPLWFMSLTRARLKHKIQYACPRYPVHQSPGAIHRDRG